MGWFSASEPEMSREDTLSSHLTLWEVQVRRGDTDHAQQTLDEIHRLQWEIGQGLRRR